MYPDENNVTLPVSVNRIKNIPLQLSSVAEAEVVSKVGGSTLATTATTCIIEIIISFLLKASLSQLWGMINCQ